MKSVEATDTERATKQPEMPSVIPIFRSTYSIGRSLLTGEPSSDTFRDDQPVSIFTIAKKYGLKKVILIDDEPTGFPVFYRQSKQEGVHLIFGQRIVLADNKTQLASDGLTSKVCVLIKNSEGYADFVKLVSWYNASKHDNVRCIFIDDFLNLLTDNLMVMVPFYDSFLYSNSLYGSKFSFQFPRHNTFFTVESHELPCDMVMADVVTNYCKYDKYELVQTHHVCYYADSDLPAAMVYRIANSRRFKTNISFDAPDLEFFGVETFSFESFCKLTGRQFIKYEK